MCLKALFQNSLELKPLILTVTSYFTWNRSWKLYRSVMWTYATLLAKDSLTSGIISGCRFDAVRFQKISDIKGASIRTAVLLLIYIRT